MVNHLIDELLALASAVDGLHTYIEDYNCLSGGRMAEKYRDDPMAGFRNVERRSKAVYRLAEAALKKHAEKSA